MNDERADEHEEADVRDEVGERAADAAPAEEREEAAAPADATPERPAHAEGGAAGGEGAEAAASESRERWIDRAIGSAIATAYVAWLLLTARSLGFSRDEGFYFSAGYSYQRWFKLLLEAPARAFERAAIDASWATNHEHPSLMKGLFSLSHLFLYTKHRVFEDASTAFRFPAMLTMGLALYVTYRFATDAYRSRRAGVAAAFALGLAPRVFYHAHLACFDVPIMAMWVSSVYVYWIATKRGGLGWALAAGVVYGLTLETKHNAWMLPAVFVVHALAVHGRSLWAEARTGRVPIPASLLAMATVGPALFVLLWPWLWNDTLPRLQEYVNFHLNHEYYNIEFLGRTYFAPPSPPSYMPVMIAATVPTVTLVLFVVGLVERGRLVLASFVSWLLEGTRLAATRVLGVASDGEDDAKVDLLVLLALAVPLAVFLLPRTPIFGGTKHWIPAYPLLAMLAGRAFDRAASALERALPSAWDATRRHGAVAAMGAMVFLAPAAITRHSHPFGLSSYVPLVGGTAGGADLGLNRQFWGFTTQSLAPYFETLPQGSRVYIMDTSWPSWQRLIDEKRVRPDLRGVGSPAEADVSLVHHEQHINEVDYNIWVEYGRAAPDHVLTHDGVPIVSVYRRSVR